MISYFIRLTAAALIVVTVTASADATARHCAERDTLGGFLERTYHEHRDALGVTPSGHLVELFVSDKGSWTLVLSMANGISCIISSGQGWQGGLALESGPQA